MEGKRVLHSLSLENFLSYKNETVELLPLNVLIGSNGSGKSNLIEVIDVLRAMPKDLAVPFRRGGVSEWFWKGSNSNSPAPIIRLIAVTQGYLRFLLTSKLQLLDVGQTQFILDENISRTSIKGEQVPLYQEIEGKSILYRKPNTEHLSEAEIPLEAIKLDEKMAFEQSVLSQIKDPRSYPEITYLGRTYTSFRIYRDWNLSRNSPLRQPKPADMPNDFLEEDGSNLGLVINDLQNKPAVKAQIIRRLQQFNPLVQDIATRVYGNTVQLFLHEQGLEHPIPATRISDGTLQFLCLLAILCHPKPPPLVCIEEPEAGLHPDIMPVLAELLLEASQRMQLIVSTHSDALVSALSETPEAILVCERDADGTHLRRLEREPLQEWLEKYSLGELWKMGEIGGVRW